MGRLRDNIAKEKARRARRIKEGKVSRRAVRFEATAPERDSFTRQHAHSLLAMEQMINTTARSANLDDAQVEAAIKAILQRTEPVNLGVQQLVAALKTEQERLNCDDETWDMGLCVVYRSLKTVSQCNKGETSYLDYTADFIRNAKPKTRDPRLM